MFGGICNSQCSVEFVTPPVGIKAALQMPLNMGELVPLKEMNKQENGTWKQSGVANTTS